MAREPALKFESVAPGAADGPDRGAALVAQQIWRDHRRWIAAILLAHKPRDVELEDLLQTVAMQIVRHAESIRGGRESLKPWLRTVAINAARAAGRSTTARRRNLRLVGGDALRAAEAAIEDGAAEGRGALDRGRQLLALSERLPEKYREPLLLRCVRGMSYRQIGEVMGLPETTVETRIARGRKMLREAASETETPVGATSDGDAT